MRQGHGAKIVEREDGAEICMRGGIMIQVVEGGIKRAVKSWASVLVLVLVLVLVIVRLSLAGMDEARSSTTH